MSALDLANFMKLVAIPCGVNVASRLNCMDYGIFGSIPHLHALCDRSNFYG